jgi:predicted nucleotidyltransferase
MGVTLPKDTTLAGFTMTQVKHALRSYARTGEAQNFFEIESFAPSRLEAAALYEELLERKLIDPSGHSQESYLTEEGLAIASGKTRRSSLAAARKVLDELLARIERTNATGQPVNVVDRVWLFGSVMREQETVGDIDLAIELIHNPAFPDDSSRWKRHQELVDLAPSHLPYFRKFGWHEERGIFGERRHPLLAGAHLDSDELQRLGVPCQLIFDRSREGRVDDTVLPRHPDSSGRSNEMPAARELPDLTPIPATPLPLDARWISAYRVDGSMSPHRLFSVRRSIPGSGCFVLTDGTKFYSRNWRPRSLRAGGFDGVSRVLLKFQDWQDQDGRHAAAIVLHREIRDLGGEIEFRVALSDYERPRRLEPKLDHTFLQLCGMVAMAMCGDIHRQTMRLNERSLEKRIVVDLNADALPEQVRGAAPVWIEHVLNELAPRADGDDECEEPAVSRAE